MSHTPEPNRDELRDRLVDQALREVLGREAPPDLSDKILAAADKQALVSPQRKEQVMDSPKRSFRNWALGAIAACLLVGVSIALVIPAMQSAREMARVTPEDYKSVAESAQQSSPGSDDEGGESAGKDPQGAPDTSPMDSAAPMEGAPAPKNEAPSQNGKLRFGKEFGAWKVHSSDPSATPKPSASAPGSLIDGRGFSKLEEDRDRTGYWGTEPSGVGPGRGGDQYDNIVENPFRAVKDHPLSTLSIDVDTASYANVRRFLLQESRLPPPDAVRIEEMINYFDYDYTGPKDDRPFSSHMEVAGCPWTSGHRLVRIGLKGRDFPDEERPESNLVFLLDVSGSMNSPDKLPLLKEGMKMLASQMRDQDRVAIVVYASAQGLALPSTSGKKSKNIIAALDNLSAGGSTAGGAGIQLAYSIAQENFIPGGVNRVLLCTDGDFNVGTTSTGDLVRMVEERAQAGVFLSVLGFGRGNLNDAMMENISNKGNGNYSYIDGITEAHKVLVQQMGGTLVTIAKDVKIQVEFNPQQVAAYRLLGYENRILASEDFNDDKKDAGEIGAGHTVTALYEVVPVGAEIDVPSVDPLKYQSTPKPKADGPKSDEMLTLKLRYKEPEGTKSKLLEFPLVDSGARFGQASVDMQFASAVASFGMLLRGSAHSGTGTYDAVLEIASSAKGHDLHGYRVEFLEMVRRAKSLAGK